MDDATLPYFFPEALLAESRRQPSERERARSFTVKDLYWLKNLLLASHADRSKQPDPMKVDRLLLNTPGNSPPLILAGAFMIGPTPDDKKVILYTPYGGLEKFENAGTLMAELSERLDTPAQRIELLRFLSIPQRTALKPEDKLTISTSLIEGDVFEDQATTIRLYQSQNVQAMLAELLKLPTLTSMLNATLDSALQKHVPGLDHSKTRMSSFIEDVSGDSPEDSLPVRRGVDSVPLSEALLNFYQKQAWPLGRAREFVNPKRPYDPADSELMAKDKQLWEQAVKTAAGSLTLSLTFHLETFWNTEVNPGQSRLAFFAEAMSDKSRMDLLFKRQDKIITAQQSQQLTALYLPDSTLRKNHKDPLHIEKVRIWEHYPNYVELAGTLMISNSSAYLYTQSAGLQLLERYEDLRTALQVMAKAAGHEDELYASLSLEERYRFISFDHPQISGAPVLGAVFLEIVRDIADKQQQNLEYALGVYRRSEGAVDIDALLDHALDIRAMLDHRLLSLDAGGRWSTRPVASDKQRPSTVQAEKAKRQEQTFKTIEDALADESETHPTLSGWATIALGKTLKFGGINKLTASEIYINRYPGSAKEREERQPSESLNLFEYFIERLIQRAKPIPASSEYGVYGKPSAGSSSKLTNPSVEAVNTIVLATLDYFKGYELSDLPRIALEEMKPRLAHAMSVGIRGEAELRVLNKTLRADDQAIINTVLNPDSADRLTRQGLNGFRPDAYALTLERTGQRALLPLANCLVLTERGGIDPGHSGRVILWTPALGLEVFSSVDSVRAELTRRLLSPGERLALLENLKERQFHQKYSLGPFRLIERDVLQDRQQSYIEQYLVERAQTLALKLPGKQLLSRLDNLKKKPARINLQRATQIAQATVKQQSLPVWLGMASATEQQRHAELFEQYLISVDADKDYLHGIQSLRDYAQEKLTDLLKRRYPEHAIDPSEVSITPRLALTGYKQALTDFALNHFDGLESTDFNVTSETANVLPEQLNATSVRQLVRQLDIKTHYQALLETHLTLGNAGAAERQQRFVKQLPWQLLQHAHGLKLQERLSEEAFALIQQVLDMPDAMARKTVQGVKTLIRPLELIATQGAAKVKALGLYLIGPEPGSKGPQILYSPYYPNHVFKEYEDETSFLSEFRAAGALQNWVLRLLPDSQQATYRNLLTATNQQSSEIKLASTPIIGSLLKQLFGDNTPVLSKMLGSQSEANRQSEWETVKDLFQTGVQQEIQVLAGKLAYPIVVWQSYQYFKESAEDLQEHKWGPAIKAFINGVAQLATIRKAMESPSPSAQVPPVAEEPVASEPAVEPPAVVTTWANMDLTAPQRTRLQPYEVMDVALNSLKKSDELGVYEDAVTKQQYIPLSGKVYRIEKGGDDWRIISDQKKGPFVRKTDAQQWGFDAHKHLPRYVGALTRLNSKYTTWSSAREGMNIEAAGMKNIRRLYPVKARMIKEALDLALFYTNNCKHNLRLLDPAVQPVTRVHQFVKTLFGVSTIEPGHIQKLTTVIDSVLAALVDPSLTSLDSKRFVTGSHRTSPETHMAFTIPADVEHKLYLSSRFFNTGYHLYQSHLIVPFNIDAHARATTLIHELTHIVCGTEDIAYLEATRPFHDLLDAITGKNLKEALQDIQTTALSILTPATDLFQVLDQAADTWVDPGTTLGTEHIESHILNLTGGTDLADARRIFYADPLKRIDTLLGNADSIAYLITQLGRQLDPVPSSRPVSPIP
ncbi:dermonecrotic toxin domain-containing protein [Pseudomonas sp. H11T01]|uniref:dermonecrotic toxin domain-containing protein n=1 Tax=Pseudomonas sp. H11T01 TaxID=3402749 RepID=UPI003AD22CDF